MSEFRLDSDDSGLNRSVYGWKPESEIRFVVDKFDCSILDGYACPKRIEQGYFQTAPYLTQRIRIINQNIAMLTKKFGQGELRGELEVKSIDPRLAQIMYDEMCINRVVKVRYDFADGWLLDIYEYPAGLVVLEYEGGDSGSRRDTLPTWIHDAQEITNIATNADIARWAQEEAAGLLQCSIRDMLRPIPHVVLAGGPGSGKSTLFEGLRKQLPGIVFVVEAARMLIETAGHQPPIGSVTGMNRFERGIFDTHKLLVGLAEDEARRVGAHAVVTDRHAIDVLAYLDNDRQRFEQICNTWLDYEYAKGDWIFYCTMPPRETYEKFCMGDGVRWENYDQAMATDQRLRQAYVGFGDRIIEVPFLASKEEKLRLVLFQLTTRLKMSKPEFRWLPTT